MDFFEANKIAGAVLGSLLFALSLKMVSDSTFFHPEPVKPGYNLPSPEEAAPAKPIVPAVAPIEERLAKADAKKGEADAKPCTACHNFEKGAGAKIGPPLWGVVGRPKGSVEGFDYSGAIKSKGGTWTDADLDQFLADPKAYAPGTKMIFAGVEDPQQRADVIAYLHTLAEPVPLPGK